MMHARCFTEQSFIETSNGQLIRRSRDGIDEIFAEISTIIGTTWADNAEIHELRWFIGMVVDGVKEVFTLNEESALQDTIIGTAKDTLLDISFKGTLRIDKEFIHIINLDELMIEIEN